MTTTEHLVAALDTAGVLPTAWREAFLAVPRHAFLPAKIWVDDGAAVWPALGTHRTAQHGHRSGALELITEAEIAATRLDSTRMPYNPFSSTNVAIYQIGVSPTSPRRWRRKCAVGRCWPPPTRRCSVPPPRGLPGC